MNVDELLFELKVTEKLLNRQVRMEFPFIQRVEIQTLQFLSNREFSLPEIPVERVIVEMVGDSSNTRVFIHKVKPFILETLNLILMMVCSKYRRVKDVQLKFRSLYYTSINSIT
jgi:hypothetical protein